ncbi:MAG TPA: hypothetical protein VFH17_08075 [Coriobacteriia bacterium]|nr:hypothetical protein [Coriobacteriia bacterium]
MSRRVRPLTADAIARLGRPCDSCVYWESPHPLDVRCGAACDASLLRSRISQVNREWGVCGRVAIEDEAVLGFVKYAPARYYPQSRSLPTGAPEPSAPLLTCLHVRESERSRGLDKLLLHATLRDLHGRGETALFAYGYVHAEESAAPMPSVGFLLENGFSVERPHADLPLLRLEIHSLASWTDSLESALEALLSPLGGAKRTPRPSVE